MIRENEKLSFSDCWRGSLPDRVPYIKIAVPGGEVLGTIPPLQVGALGLWKVWGVGDPELVKGIDAFELLPLFGQVPS